MTTGASKYQPQGGVRAGQRSVPQISAVSTRHGVFQTSMMSALLDGIYDGDMTVGELLGRGSFGIGTFTGLDGEMIVLEGRCFQLRVDGSCHEARMDQHTPFATVTNFVPNVTYELPVAMTRAHVSEVVDRMTFSPNYLYALRITGTFRWVTTRTVQKQEKPYRPMTKVTEHEPVLRHEAVRGVVAGFRTPLYEQGINVPGCHVHFVDDARTSGGHVLDFVAEAGATVELCVGTDLQVRLPITTDFQTANLVPDDLVEQISKTEQHKG